MTSQSERRWTYQESLDKMQQTRTRASYEAGLFRGLQDLLRLIDDPASLETVEEQAPPHTRGDKFSVALWLVRSMTKASLSRHIEADREAGDATNIFFRLSEETPAVHLCDICRECTSEPIGTIDYGPPPSDDEMGAV